MSSIGKTPPPTIHPSTATSGVAATSGTTKAHAASEPIVVPDAIALEASKLSQAGKTREALQLLAEHVPTIKLALSKGFGEAHSTAEQNAGIDLFRDTLRNPPANVA